MVQLTDKYLEAFKEICKKQGTEYYTEAEYREAAQSLLNYFDLIYDLAKEDFSRQKRLEGEPGGFEMEGGGRTCPLCRRIIYGDEKLWFDKWGMKCMDCQSALNKKIIPGYVFKDDKNEKHITASTLSWKSNIRIQTIFKLVRQGKLKPREIPGNGALVFLKRENPDLGSIIKEQKTRSKSA